MTDRIRQTRRYTIHVPQLVGRIAYPQHNEDPPAAMRRLVGDYDTAMQELQRFLKYLQDSSDDVVASGGYYPDDPEVVTAAAGDPGDPTLGWSPGTHRHQVEVGAPAGLGNANANGANDTLARSDHVHKRDVRVKQSAVDVGTRNAVNFSTDFVVADNVGGDRVDVSLSPPGGIEEALALAFLGL